MNLKSKLKKVFIVAEIGNNHEGKFETALNLIDQACIAGADAVKFQTFKAENFISSSEKQRFNKLKSFQLSYEEFEKIANYAKKKKIIFFSTPLDIESAFFLNKIQKLFKIASGDNNFYELIKVVSSFKKFTIISSGLANLKTLKKITDFVPENRLAFLHCVSSYPVDKEEINLLEIQKLKNEFPKIPIGYSDHSKDYLIPIYAVILGAQIIEKHFTLDKKFSNFRDHSLSADPKEMRLIVNRIRELEIILGKKKIYIKKSEQKNIQDLRRSFAVSEDLPKNHILKKNNLIFLRPGCGLTKKKLIIGKKLSKNLKSGMIIKSKHLKNN